MAINKQTIISAFDDKLTLLQWLKTINKALDEAVLTGVEVRQKGNATYSFVVTFEDGTELESNEFVLAQGESINGATIRNGHLYLSLTNGDELDAGNLKPVTSFEINASQHLIVNYGDGTSQDLGAIFSGNVNVDGNFTANSIIENMDSNSYYFNKLSETSGIERTFNYVGIVKNGNKLTIVISGTLKRTNTSTNSFSIGDFYIPNIVGSKLFTYTLSPFDNIVASVGAQCWNGFNISNKKEISILFQKYNDNYLHIIGYSLPLEIDTTYVFRIEQTFLLSDNLAGN